MDIQPAKVAYTMRKGEFLFLGREYPLDYPDFGKIWGDFLSGGHGGYATLEKFQVEGAPDMNAFLRRPPDRRAYMIGKIVEGIDRAPDGFSLLRIPASDYLAVTYEWVPAGAGFNHHTGEFGNEQNWEVLSMPPETRLGRWECLERIADLRAPDGFRVRAGEGNPIYFFEVDRFHTSDGDRIEFWVPIERA